MDTCSSQIKKSWDIKYNTQMKSSKTIIKNNLGHAFCMKTEAIKAKIKNNLG